MKTIALLVAFLVVVLGAYCCAADDLEVRRDAYGLGVDADQYGRPHHYESDTCDGCDVDDTLFEVERDTYGLDVHMDEFGRPVQDVEGR